MDTYRSPLVSRGASKEMAKLWGEKTKFILWRRLWVELAKRQKELGLPFTDEQIFALEKSTSIRLNEDTAKKYEEEIRHDVMAHIKAFGDQVPIAKGIIHLGATSQFVVDNADCMRIATATIMVADKLNKLIIDIGEFAYTHRKVPTLGYTHYQPAQATTVGKRAAVWAYNLILILEDINDKIARFKSRGVKGATGTQASFLQLFDGDYEKVKSLDLGICSIIGAKPFAVTGQTYPRVIDAMLISSLAALAAECQKIATDIRLLSHDHEVMEGFGNKQVGSSAMPYKKNPITCERVCGLAKLVIGMSNTAFTITSEQWLERSLDDSSPRRVLIPEVFLAVDAIIESMRRIFSNIVVNKAAIKQHCMQNAVKLTVEKILMIAVKNGADRQAFHEKLRQCSTKYSGKALLENLASLPELEGVDVRAECQRMDITGCATLQTEEFYKEFIIPLKDSDKE